MNKRQIVIEIICFLFIVLFVYAALTKFIDIETFQTQIGQSPLLTAWAKWVALAVPVIELFICVLLGIPFLRLAGLYASFCIMVMFTSYIIAITQFSEYIPCSCGGILQKMGWTEHLIFNIGFVLLAFTGIILSVSKNAVKKPIFS